MSDSTNASRGAVFDALATRGHTRGADAVLTAAITAADTTADGVPVADLSPSRPRPTRRSRARRGFGVVGVAALLGVGGYALAGVQGNGTGADSPQAAVQQLATAIDHEDALAAVATLNPAEITSMQSTVSKAEHKAQQTKLVDSSSAPFAGIDLSVDGLHTDVSDLAPGTAMVRLSGSISAKVSAGQLSEVLQRVAGNADGSVDLARLGVRGGQPFLITVERDGKWYVSPAYTAFEYAVTSEGLPAAQFGSADPSKLGAASAQDAVEQALRAIGAGDWNTVASLAPPSEFPLYEYRAAFTKLMNDTFGSGQLFTVDQLDATQHVDGTHATVDLTASGVYTQGTTPNPKWKLTQGCVWAEAFTPRLHPYIGWCLAEHGSFPLDLRNIGNPPPSAPTEIHAVEESGRWYVSPMDTVLGYLDTWVGNFDDASLASLLHEPLLTPVTGQLALDQPVHVPNAGGAYLFPEYAHYTLHVDGPTDVVADTRIVVPGEPAGGFSDAAYATTIYGPGGTQLVPDSTWTRYHLPAAGTYDVTTMRRFAGSDSTLTIWRAADAPKDVPQGESGCRPTKDGGVECTASGVHSSWNFSGSSGTSGLSPLRPPTTIQVRPTTPLVTTSHP